VDRARGGRKKITTANVVAAMRRQGLNTPYLPTRTKLNKVYKLSATT
jgi:hypothetical protein